MSKPLTPFVFTAGPHPGHSLLRGSHEAPAGPESRPGAEEKPLQELRFPGKRAGLKIGRRRILYGKPVLRTGRS